MRALEERAAEIAESERDTYARATALGVVTTDSAEVRESPPHGPFNMLIGAEVQARVEPGTFVAIVGEKHVGTFSGREVWYAIRPLQVPPHSVGMEVKEWWINAGIEGVGGQTPGVRVAWQATLQ